MENKELRPYLERAYQELRAAEINIREEFYAVAVSRCYYAIFYATSAMLASIGINRSKHTGLVSAFRQYFIKPGLIEVEFGDIIGVSFEARQESDYELIPYIDRELALQRWVDAKKFVNRIESFLMGKSK